MLTILPVEPDSLSDAIENYKCVLEIYVEKGSDFYDIRSRSELW